MRSLRARLGLDSGYLSRLLRSLEAARPRRGRPERGRPAGADRAADRAGAARSGPCSTSAATSSPRSLLAPLERTSSDRLVAAMDEVERLLTAGDGRDRSVDPAHRRRAALPGRVLRRAGPALSTRGSTRACASPPGHELRPPTGLFLVATLHGEPVGCGALKIHGRATGRDEAHVGGRAGARPRGGAPAARRARGARGRPRQPGRSDWRRTTRSPRRSPCTARPDTWR